MSKSDDPASYPAEPPRNPIVLGVVGHVDPRREDLTALKAAFEEILADFRERHPSTPLVVMSSLARGTDQLAAGVALDRKEPVRVVAPLPFPVEVYAQSSSFQGDDDARDRFLSWVSDPALRGKVGAYVVNRPDEPDRDDLAGWMALMRDDHQRHVCYANAGGYIIRHCHALVAFWDGQTTPKPSGTAEIVACKRGGRTLDLDPWRKRLPLLNSDAEGPVYVIHTPRSHGAAPATAPADAPDAEPGHAPAAGYSWRYRPGDWGVLTPNADGPVDPADLDWEPGHWHRFWRRVAVVLTLNPHAGRRAAHHGAEIPPGAVPPAARRARDEFRQFHETCKSIDDFNRDAATHAALIDRRLAKLPESELGKDAAGMDIPEPLTRLMRLRAAAAVMAAYFEWLFTVLLIILFSLFFLAAVFFHVYAHYESREAPGVHNPSWLAAFVGSLLLAVLLVCLVRAGRLGERRHDYRALAEALRVRIYWGLAGIGKSVADSYLGQLRSEMSWTRRALQCAAPPPAYWTEYFRKKTMPEQVEQLRLVGRRWIDHQSKYFHRRFRNNDRAAKWLDLSGLLLALMGWFIAGILVVLWVARGSGEQAPTREDASALQIGGSRPHPDPRVTDEPSIWDPEHPSPWVLIVSGVLALSGALLIAYCEQRSHEELARQYERMWVIFRRGAAEFRGHLAAGDVESAQRVLETLGHEAITEHAQWLILRRNRPFELLIH